MIARDATLFRTLKNVPARLRLDVERTAKSIEADFPNLPAHDDVEVLLPPQGHRWARRVGASTWWVLYTWSIVTQTLIIRTVNEIP